MIIKMTKIYIKNNSGERLNTVEAVTFDDDPNRVRVYAVDINGVRNLLYIIESNNGINVDIETATIDDEIVSKQIEELERMNDSAE